MLATLVFGCALVFGVDSTCIRTEPADPRPGQPFDIVYEGWWPDTKVPVNATHVALSGRDIRISLVAPTGFAGQAVTPFRFIIPAQRFAPTGVPAGTYRILVRTERAGWGTMAAEFELVDVDAPRIEPRAGIWRTVDADYPRKEDGLRLAFAFDGETAHVLMGTFEATFPHVFAVGRRTWAEGRLRMQPGFVSGALVAPREGRLYNGSPDGMVEQAVPPPIRIAVEWIDARHGLLYLLNQDVGLSELTTLPLYLDAPPLEASRLEGQWLLATARGGATVASSLVWLELASAEGAAWLYRDRSSRLLLSCVATVADAACTLRGSVPGASVRLQCDDEGCEGSDAGGGRTKLIRWP